MKSEEYKRNKDKFQKILKTVSEISKSELAPFLDHKKFLHSTLFHQIAVFAAMHYKEHSDSTPIMQVLDFTKLKGTEYLKAVRWFEYRTGTCFFIEDNKLKKSKSNTLLDENYQMFGDFLKTYKGPLPVIKSSVHDKFHRTLILSGFCLLKIAKISLNSSFFPKPIKR